MDSEVKIDGSLIDIIDEEWATDKLPLEDVEVPLDELPEPEQDNGNSKETINEMERKWTDDNMQSLLNHAGTRQS
ncbi:anaphase-promoting complex subunit 13-like [Clavelina lepadiformis]|uniref:Anaphase-promoting complex subunit 13 n=1 Tax=Clavelina lepadiformis TaxID=159417 RepID=A0ABP0FDK8_CLALP